MTPPRARILQVETTAVARRPLLAPPSQGATHRRIARELLEARAAAERIESEACARAEALVAGAHEARDAEERAAGADAAHLVTLAVLLAERILGEELALAPERIVSIARRALAEVPAVRRAALEAHPDDARALRDALAPSGSAGSAGSGQPAGSARRGTLEEAIAEIREDPSLARGSLRLHTEGGTLDAQLLPRLERLAAALRDALP